MQNPSSGRYPDRSGRHFSPGRAHLLAIQGRKQGGTGIFVEPRQPYHEILPHSEERQIA